jgi:hypothetical protein
MKTLFVSACLLSLFVLVGCGGSDNSAAVDPKADAAKMTADQLKAKVESLTKTVVAAAQKKVDDLKAELAKLAPADVAGAKGKDLTAKVADATKALEKAQADVKVYADELAKKGAKTE